MPTYIDESGDTGRVADGGKPYFRMAAVWAPDDETVRSFQEGLADLRRRHDLSDRFEFKYSKTKSPVLRSEFFALALAREIRFAFSQIDKTAARWRDATGEEQYQACAAGLTDALKSLYIRHEEKLGKPLRERVVIDRNDDRRFLKIMKTKFQSLRSPSHPDVPLVVDVCFRKSHPEPCLQLADMVCGAVGSWIDGKDRMWYERIKSRSVGEPSGSQTQTAHRWKIPTVVRLGPG